MFRWIFSKRAQNTAEYAILISLVVAAAIGMQTYVKRGLQGRVRDTVDHVGASGDVGGTTLTFTGEQFEPNYLASDFTTQQAGNRTVAVKEGGGVRTDVAQDDVTSRTGEQKYTYEEE